MLLRLGFGSAALDAKLLTGHALGLDALALATREQERVTEEAAERVAALMRRRMAGESVARILGAREFYGLSFALGAATLEPRPETELLVDLAIAALPEGGRLLDLGTGTGCIPIAVLANRPDADGLATDISAEALDVARGNAARHGVADRLGFAQGSWFGALALTSPLGGEVDPVAGRVRGPFQGSVPEEGPLTRPSTDLSPQGRGDKFALITSNPPYISSAVIETLAPEVKDFDPLLALDGGPDGLAPYRIIAAQAEHVLVPGGQVLVEIGYDQGDSVGALFAEHGFADIVVHKDLNGLDRVISAHHLKDK